MGGSDPSGPPTTRDVRSWQNTSGFVSILSMSPRVLARARLWEIAEDQRGYVTASQAIDHGVTRGALDQLVARGTLLTAAHGVYRFPRYPVSISDPYMLAVLWTRAPEAALSHETALHVFDICDINPSVIHVVVGKHRRLRRADASRYVVHRQDLGTGSVTWWEEVPVVSARTAIEQCLELGTPTYLLCQAIERGRSHGRLTAAERDVLTDRLRAERG